MTPVQKSSPTPQGSGPIRLAGALVIAALISIGCEIPTDLPAVETRWIVPTEETRFGVNELLPGDVSFTTDSSAFIVNFTPIAFSETLGDLCPPCALADGMLAPKPPFVATLGSQIDFPPEVSAFTVLDGDVVFDVFNGTNFDPIRPASGVFGSLTLTVRDDADGDVLATLVIDGAATAFAPTSTLTRSLALDPTDVNGSLVAEILVNSPAGDPITINSSDSVAVTVTPVNIRVAGVTIDVANRSVDLDPTTLDLEDIDQDIEDRVVSGSFNVDVTNPFGIGADLQLTITGPTITTIQKSAPITALPTSTVTIAFTIAELRSMLGEPDITLSGGATVSAAANVITVTPGQELILSANLDLILRIGGGS